MDGLLLSIEANLLGSQPIIRQLLLRLEEQSYQVSDPCRLLEEGLRLISLSPVRDRDYRFKLSYCLNQIRVTSRERKSWWRWLRGDGREVETMRRQFRLALDKWLE